MRHYWIILMALLVNGCATHRPVTAEKQPPAPEAMVANANTDASLAKLSPELRALANDTAKSPNTPSSPAIVSSGGKVEVEIIVDAAEAAPELKAPVEALGGSVTSQFRNHVFASLPIANLKRAAAMAHVTMIQPSKPLHVHPAGQTETPK